MHDGGSEPAAARRLTGGEVLAWRCRQNCGLSSSSPRNRTKDGLSAEWRSRSISGSVWACVPYKPHRTQARKPLLINIIRPFEFAEKRRSAATGQRIRDRLFYPLPAYVSSKYSRIRDFLGFTSARSSIGTSSGRSLMRVCGSASIHAISRSVFSTELPIVRRSSAICSALSAGSSSILRTMSLLSRSCCPACRRTWATAGPSRGVWPRPRSRGASPRRACDYSRGRRRRPIWRLGLSLSVRESRNSSVSTDSSGVSTPAIL
jgi:hypothetical protein